MYQNSCSHDVRFLRYGIKRAEVFVIFGHFLTFTTHRTWKTKKKMKKAPAKVVILHICTKTHVHMMYAPWDMECERQNFDILDHFLPFYPTNNPKNQYFRNIKKLLGILSWFLRHRARRTKCFIILDHFCSFTPFKTRKVKILKK